MYFRKINFIKIFNTKKKGYKDDKFNFEQYSIASISNFCTNFKSDSNSRCISLEKNEELKKDKISYKNFSIKFLNFVEVLKKNDYETLNPNFNFKFLSNQNKNEYFDSFKKNSKSFKAFSKEYESEIVKTLPKRSLRRARSILPKQKLLEL